MNSLEEIEKKEIGEKEIMVEEYEKNRNDVVVRVVKRETLDTRKDIELGERTVHANGKVIHYIIYGHVNKDKSITFYIYYFIVHGGITEIFRIINKNTVISMLARMNHIYDRIKDFIPNFESEKERVQMIDRLNDGLFTDKEIVENLNKVQSFHFFGEEGYCGKSYPHLPHVLYYYDTVRYGKLPLFCTGKSGKLLLKDGRKAQILITKSCREDCSGHYVIFELLDE